MLDTDFDDTCYFCPDRILYCDPDCPQHLLMQVHQATLHGSLLMGSSPEDLNTCAASSYEGPLDQKS